VTIDQYCRDIETYLCRKNGGHLIRIVGPSFDLVCGWASQGVPLKVACRGIDRYFDRHAREPRRRPARIDFCEADVLDVFDEWRRAVGIGMAGSTAAGEASDAEPADRRKKSLRAHLDRVVLKIGSLQAMDLPRDLEACLDRTLAAIGELRDSAKTFRGPAREQALSRLAALDAQMIGAARAVVPDDLLKRLTAAAEEDLAPFRERMPRETFAQALDAALGRQLRDHFNLPQLAFE
jgi:hypothetical protein